MRCAFPDSPGLSALLVKVMLSRGQNTEEKVRNKHWYHMGGKLLKCRNRKTLRPIW